MGRVTDLVVDLHTNHHDLRSTPTDPTQEATHTSLEEERDPEVEHHRTAGGQEVAGEMMALGSQTVQDHREDFRQDVMTGYDHHHLVDGQDPLLVHAVNEVLLLDEFEVLHLIHEDHHFQEGNVLIPHHAQDMTDQDHRPEEDFRRHATVQEVGSGDDLEAHFGQEVLQDAKIHTQKTIGGVDHPHHELVALDLALLQTQGDHLRLCILIEPV